MVVSVKNIKETFGNAYFKENSHVNNYSLQTVSRKE